MFGETSISQVKVLKSSNWFPTISKWMFSGTMRHTFCEFYHFPFRFHLGKLPRFHHLPRGKPSISPWPRASLRNHYPARFDVDPPMALGLIRYPVVKRKGETSFLPQKITIGNPWDWYYTELKLNWFDFIIHGRQPPYHTMLWNFLASSTHGDWQPSLGGITRADQTLMAFQYIDCFIGILILAYYNPHISG